MIPEASGAPTFFRVAIVRVAFEFDFDNKGAHTRHIKTKQT